MNTPEPESQGMEPRQVFQFSILCAVRPAPPLCLFGGTVTHLDDRTLVRVLLDPALAGAQGAYALRAIADRVEGLTDTQREEGMAQAEEKRKGWRENMPLPPILAEACGNCSNPRQAMQALAMLWTHDMEGLFELGARAKEEGEE